MGEASKVLVWDLPVRVFHWLLVALVGFSWWSGEAGGTALKYHFWSGYSILTLVLFRLVWGCIGGEYARFGSFVRGPRQVWRTLRELPTRRRDHSVGHNPAGGWMVIAMLMVLIVQVATGLGANDDLFNEGPWYDHVSKSLSDSLTGLHHLNFIALLVLVALHVGAIVWHRAAKGENLVTPMVTGYKQLTAPSPRPVSLWRAGVTLAAAAACVFGIVNV